MNRRGTEKPIEIFVALFIILALALIMLKLFQTQIADNKREFTDAQQLQHTQELQLKLRLACQQKCTDASNNGCSEASLASLCAYSSRNVLSPGQYIDLNNNRVKDLDISHLAGIGVCEDHLYCFHMVESCCAQRIDPSSCRIILDSYWTARNLSTDAQMLLTVPSGIPASCSPMAGVTNWNEPSLVGGTWQ